MTGMYQKLDYMKCVTYRITEVFTNGTLLVQKGKVKKLNIYIYIYIYKTYDASLH